MDRVHPIHVITLIVAAAAAIFAFVAMWVAFDARDEARSAASSAAFAGSGGEVDALVQAMIRTGLIEDPWIIPDDYQQLDGPWARCLTAGEHAAMGLGDDVELPEPCATVAASRETVCSEPLVTTPSDGYEDDAIDPEPCELVFHVDGRRFDWISDIHPWDVEVMADEWFVADSADGIDRVARGDGSTFIHIVGEGWRVLYRD
jgi:hypothetical protein